MPTGSAPPTERALPRLITEIIRDRLPHGWLIDEPNKPGRNRQSSPDLLLNLVAPDGSTATLVGEVKQVLEGRDVGPLAEQLDAYLSESEDASGLVGARYLSSQTRDRLTERGISFVDATGNVRIQIAQPAFFISDRGADSDPWRGPGRPRGTLNGEPAARVVRAVADFSGEWAVTDLISVSGVSTGAAYRVVEFLETQGLAERPNRGIVSVPDWRRVLRRWSQDYAFIGNSRVSRWIGARGLDDLLARAASSTDTRYAVTGTVAAAEWAAYAPARAAMIYVADAKAAAQDWGLRPAEAGANVILGEPELDVPFVRTGQRDDGLVMAAPSQVVVDLMTGPGRNPAEAEELLAWMASHEQSWRK